MATKLRTHVTYGLLVIILFKIFYLLVYLVPCLSSYGRQIIEIH